MENIWQIETGQELWCLDCQLFSDQIASHLTITENAYISIARNFGRPSKNKCFKHSKEHTKCEKWVPKWVWCLLTLHKLKYQGKCKDGGGDAWKLKYLAFLVFESSKWMSQPIQQSAGLQQGGWHRKKLVTNKLLCSLLSLCSSLCACVSHIVISC